jgi:tetraacyldisaccharide 4'-kinase
MSGLLSPLAAAYGAVAARRMARPGRAAGIPVVCLGNLTLGGAGKTPSAMAVARMLDAAGRRPFLLSRGYGGRMRGPLRVDAAVHRAADVGDEPLLLARVAPTIVARDRAAGAQAARDAGARSIVMDDGFQNPAVAKDLSIVVVDAVRGIGNGLVFPAGPLRAPLDDQLAHAHALLVIGTGSGGIRVVAAARGRGLPVFHGRLEPDGAALAPLRGRKVLAFAGIGDPDKFFATLAAAGIQVAARQVFPDHHRFRIDEAREIIARAERELLVPVTTEKDLVRLSGADELAPLAGVVRVLPVALVVDEQAAFRDLLLARTG